MTSPSELFLEYLDDMSAISIRHNKGITSQKWTSEHNRELVEAFIQEALKGQDIYDYLVDFECKPTAVSPFHGKIDFLIYDKTNQEHYGFPLIPVMIMPERVNLNGHLMWDSNCYQLGAVATWLYAYKASLSQSDKAFK